MTPSIKDKSANTDNPPVNEQGYVNRHGFDKLGELITWANVLDERETTRELTFPESVNTYKRMRSTDAHIAAIIAAITMPIRRFKWQIDPNGASEEAVTLVAEDLGLPILGAEGEAIQRRTRNRFSHDRHLRDVLRGTLTYGWQMHEQVAYIDEQGAVRLRKLAARPQHTITEIRVATDGGLMGIKQGYGVDAPVVDVSRLVAYNMDAEPGNWTGESLLRAMYRPWKIKDRIMRVGAINIERAGGIPWVEAAQGANGKELQRAMAFAQQFRVGENAGGALPFGWQLKFAQAAGGNEAAEYVKLQNQEMSRRALAMFLDLGTTETGARALGEGFIDFFSLQLDTLAGEYADVTNEHVIEDLIDWNFSIDENAPRLVYDRSPDPELAVEDLSSLVTSGLIVVDNDLEDSIRGKYRLPEAVRVEAAPVNAPAYGYDLDNPILKIDDRRAQLGLPPREDGLGNMTVPEFLSMIKKQEAAATPDTPEQQATAALGSDFVAAAKARVERHTDTVSEAVYAAADPNERVKLPARKLRRQPNEHEIKAALDLEAIDAAWTDALDALLAKWKAIRAEQIDAIVAQVEATSSIADLASIEIETRGVRELEEAMISLVAEGVDQAQAEAAEQGVTLSEPEVEAIADEIEERAAVIASMLTDELRNAGIRRAQSIASGDFDADVVAAETRAHLEALKEGWLETQLGGALSNAMNTGRAAAMETGEDAVEEYRSTALLDANTCGPCRNNDNRVYAKLADALKDYPTGPYKRCEGGLKCRCFVYGVYAEEINVGDEVAAAKETPAQAAARKARKYVRNNAGQFGTKDIRIKGMQDRVSKNRGRKDAPKVDAPKVDRGKPAANLRNDKGFFVLDTSELPKVAPRDTDPGPLEAHGGTPNAAYNDKRLKALGFDSTFPPDPDEWTQEAFADERFYGPPEPGKKPSFNSHLAYGGYNSQGTFVVEDPARAKLHNDILLHFLAGKTPPPKGKARATIMSGGSGAGKGSVERNAYDADEKAIIANSVTIDPDAIKELLPEFRAMVVGGDGAAAAFVHEESSMLAKTLGKLARERGYNVLYDGTANSPNPGKTVDLIKSLKAEGYEVHVNMVDLPTEIAVERAITRAFGDGDTRAGSGRMVPSDMVREIHGNATFNHFVWRNTPEIDSFRVWDTNVGIDDVPPLIASGGGGKIEIHDQAGYDRLMEKARTENVGGRALPT